MGPLSHVVFCDTFSDAALFCSALSGISLGGNKIGFYDLKDYYDKIEETYYENHHIPSKWGGLSYIFLWSEGVIGELKQPSDYDPKYKHLSNMPLPFFKNRSPSGKYETKLKQGFGDERWEAIKSFFTAKETAAIICAACYDRSGELNFKSAYDLSGSKAPCFRVKIREMTEKEITSAFGSPISEYENRPRAYSAKANEVSDHIVKTNMTAKETKALKTIQGVVPADRVLTPALNLVYEREKEIEEFTQLPYFKIEGVFSTGGGEPFPAVIGGKTFFDEQEALSFIEKEAGKEISCIGYKEQFQKEGPPLPYNMLSLLSDAERVFAIPAIKAYCVLEKLYSPGRGMPGLITYPKTSSMRLDASFMGPDFFRRLGCVSPFPSVKALKPKDSLSGPCYGGAFPGPHGAIILTGEPIPEKDGEADLTGEERKILYLIIARMAALTQGPCLLKNAAALLTDEKGNKYEGAGAEIVEEGHLSLYPKKGAAAIPALFPGQKLKLLSIAPVKSCEPAPKRYTTYTFMEAMKGRLSEGPSPEAEDPESQWLSIGRPTSWKAIIEKLKYRKHISIKKDMVYLEERGKKAILQIGTEELKNPSFAMGIERALSAIENEPVPYIAKELSVSLIKSVEEKVSSWVAS